MHFTKPTAFLYLLFALISCNNAADSPYPTITFEKKNAHARNWQSIISGFCY